MWTEKYCQIKLQTLTVYFLPDCLRKETYLIQYYQTLKGESIPRQIKIWFSFIEKYEYNTRSHSLPAWLNSLFTMTVNQLPYYWNSKWPGLKELNDSDGNLCWKTKFNHPDTKDDFSK